ncbi:MAG TPA: leucyl aminopeptidase family protein, partial [Xanthobacteraceae bacterium]|nr:leucyl aminopeptidase family protein [Xanthobacteraceae bacterium]
MHPIFVSPGAAAAPVRFVTPATWADIRAGLDAPARAFADAAGFEPRAGRHLLLPAPDGGLGGVLFGLDAEDHPARDPFLAGRLPGLLPKGTYRFVDSPGDGRLAALAFALGSYQFARYRKSDAKEVRLEIPGGVDGEDLTRVIEGVFLARDLINTPANDMGPAELEAAARRLAEQHGASIQSVVGDDLLAKNFPLVHAVGRAAEGAPRLIDMTWG